MRTRFLLWLLFLPLCACTIHQEMQTVDLIVFNARIYSVDDSVGIAEAMAVKDGHILAIGSDSVVLSRYQSEKQIDMQRRPIYPGFIDAHAHFYYYGKGQFEADLVGTKSFEEVLQRVNAFSKTQPEGWLIGRGWDQNDWAQKDFPDKSALDSLFPTRPVLLTRVDGHAALANSAALNAAGITDSSEVSGGVFVKIDGKLTGVLIDNAVDEVRKHVPLPTAEQKRKYLQKAQADAFRHGLTSIHDAGLELEYISLIQEMQEKNELRIRLYVMMAADTPTIDHFIKTGILKTDRLNVRSVKLYSDGALGSRGAALLNPYHDDPENKGLLLLDSATLERVARICYENGFQLNTHAIGDRANRMVIAAYCKRLGGKNDRRWRIEHAQIINNEDLHHFGECSILPSVQPTHATSDMYWAGERLGPERIRSGYRWKELLAQNNILPIGSDYPVEHVNPLYSFYAAVARQDDKGWPEGKFQPENALSREEALKGMTIWAAYAAFEENEKGSLRPGKFADFVVLDKDIMQVPLLEARNAKVIQTWVGGEKVFGD